MLIDSHKCAMKLVQSVSYAFVGWLYVMRQSNIEDFKKLNNVHVFDLIIMNKGKIFPAQQVINSNLSSYSRRRDKNTDECQVEQMVLNLFQN